MNKTKIMAGVICIVFERFQTNFELDKKNKSIRNTLI